VSVLRAQSTGASLTGHITDPSKALIVDAKIAAINQSTNIIYEAAVYDLYDRVYSRKRRCANV